MAMALQISTFLQQYLYSGVHKQPKTSSPLRFGVLSTANINPAALIHPAETHPDVVLYGVASRDYGSARAYASKYKFAKAYGSYQELLDDPDIDAVYNPLPNGMHYEWAKKSLEAGKHVLLEKPFTSNAAEARDLVALAVRSGKILVEGFHWQFHPAAHVVEEIVASGKYGKIVSTHAKMTSPAGTIPASDIRWKYDLAGGALMDCTYVISSTRYFVNAKTPERILSAKAKPWSADKRVDESMNAEMVFASDRGVDGKVKSTIYADMNQPNMAMVVPRVWELPSIEINLEKATIYFYNFMMPHIYHYIAITNKETGATSHQKHYSFGPKWGANSEPFWSTYRYQLEAFVDQIRGRRPGHWISLEDSIAQMETLDAVYEESGLGARKGTHEMVNGQQNGTK